jgi:hypothetical protein
MNHVSCSGSCDARLLPLLPAVRFGALAGFPSGANIIGRPWHRLVRISLWSTYPDNWEGVATFDAAGGDLRYPLAERGQRPHLHSRLNVMGYGSPPGRAARVGVLIDMFILGVAAHPAVAADMPTWRFIPAMPGEPRVSLERMANNLGIRIGGHRFTSWTGGAGRGSARPSRYSGGKAWRIGPPKSERGSARLPRFPLLLRRTGGV